MTSSTSWIWVRGVFGVVVAMLAAGADAQETVHFRQQLQVGDTIDFQQQSGMQMSFDVRSNGQILQQVQQSMQNTRTGRMEILEVSDGKPVKVRVSYAPTSGGRMESMGQRQEVPFGAAGQTVTVGRRNGMTVIDHDGNLDDATQQELTSLLDEQTTLFPDRPLRVGEAFEVDGESLKKAFELQEGKASARGTVLALRQVNGRQQAQVRLEAEISATVEGFMQMGMKLQGDSWFDAQTSRAVEATMKGPMTLSGQTAQPMHPGGQPIPMQISGGGQVNYSETSTFNAGSAGPIGGPAVNTPPAGDDNRIPGFGPGPNVAEGGPRQDVVAPNPFDDAAVVNPIAGKYSGDGLDLEIRPEGSGTIQMGQTAARIVELDQNASGSGRGRFQLENGATFEFTIERTGADTLVFKTGRSSYTVRKAAPAAPANPFDL